MPSRVCSVSVIAVALGLELDRGVFDVEVVAKTGLLLIQHGRQGGRGFRRRSPCWWLGQSWSTQ